MLATITAYLYIDNDNQNRELMLIRFKKNLWKSFAYDMPQSINQQAGFCQNNAALLMRRLKKTAKDDSSHWGYVEYTFLWFSSSFNLYENQLFSFYSQPIISFSQEVESDGVNDKW